MTERRTDGPGGGARELRARLRADLTTAMKARRRPAVTALRSAIAAIDNAEAVATSDAPIESGSEHVAGAHSGVGAAEAARRELSVDDVIAVLRSQVDELLGEAATYDEHGRGEAAANLREQAEALKGYIEG